MNDRPDDLDDRYRRESSRDSSRPSESVRRAILSHAAQLAAERAAKTRPAKIARRPAAHRARWRPAIFGTLAAAALAGLLITPHFLTPRAPSTAVRAPAAAAPQKAEGRPSSGANSLEPPRPPDVSAETSSADAMTNGPAPAVPATAARAALPTVAPPTGASGSAAAARAESVPRNEAAASAARLAGRRELNSVENFAQPRESRQADAAAPIAAQNAPGAALRRAAETGDTQALQTLLDEHADVDARDAGGRTALMLAALNGQIRAVDALLARGADPNAADAQGITPLQAALAGNQPAIAAALRRAGAR